MEGVKWIGLSIFGVLEHYNLINNLAKIKKNIIMLSMTYKNKNDYITKPVILGITQQGYAPRSFENWHRASLTS